MLDKPRLFEDLATQVIDKDLCSFCGSCMAACPLSVLLPEGEEPTSNVPLGMCALCELCYYQCPKVGFDDNHVENLLHGRTRRADEPYGIVREVFVGRALSGEIRNRAQDGGIVTALLAYAMDEGTIDAAVVAGRDEKWISKPVVATRYEDLVKNAGTKYTPSPTLLGLRSAVDEYFKKKVGVVCTPCQVRGVRRIQTSPLGSRHLAEAVVLTIGLFCMESYAHKELIEDYLAAKGVSLSAITKVAIKKGSFIVTSGEKELVKVPLKEIDTFVRNSCKQCDDFTAEYSDLSVGGVGCPNGFSTIFARTQKGLDLVTSAAKAGYIEVRELSPTEKGYLKVIKMAEAKQQRKSADKARSDSGLLLVTRPAASSTALVSQSH